MQPKQPQIGIVLVNLGTPTSPATKDVRRYLREFLMDKRVIDIPLPLRLLLVNLIIAPFRAPQSAKIYKKLWEKKVSPLLVYGKQVATLLQKELGEDYWIAIAMRYQNPSIPSVLKEMKKACLKKIIVIPLFPQYASATTGSAIAKMMALVREWPIIPNITFISNFFEEPLFIQAWAEVGKKYLDQRKFDHVLFSYHGLPERQISKSSYNNYCQLNEQCCATYQHQNYFCYRAQCLQTSRLLAEALSIREEAYTVSFQSSLGNSPWLKPYTDDVLKVLVNEGEKNILIFSPSFVADCLETTIEVGEEFKTIFKEAGGDYWQWVESLNTAPTWIACLKKLVLQAI